MKITTPTASHPQKKQPFIVREIDARMLRKHPEVSKGARMLWLTMLSMANAKTGELRHREHWYCGKEIDRRAEISDRTRQQQMKELVRFGLVRMEQERREGVLTDRLSGCKRWRKGVFGETHYTVFKSPHKDWFSYTAAQKSPHKHWPPTARKFSQPIESRNTPNKTESQNEKSPHKQRVSTARKFYRAGRISVTSTSVVHQREGVGVSGSVSGGASLDGAPVGCASPSAVESDIGNGWENNAPSSSSVSGTAPEEKKDDDLRDLPSRAELLLEKAKGILISQGHERDYVEVALDLLDERSFQLGKAPGSVAYYLKCFETLEESLTEKDLVMEHMKKRRARYAKFGIPVDVTKLQLNPEQEKARQSFNQLHANAASPSGNSITWDVVEDLVFYAERYRANATPKAVERARHLVHKKIVRFQKHIGEFRTPKEREDFAKYVARLQGEQKARAVAAGKPET